MRAEDIIASICQYGVKITDNIITDEFFAFGKIGYDAIHPMMDQEGSTINFEDIAGFSSEILGAHNLHLWVDVINKGKIDLFRSEYLPGKKYAGFRYLPPARPSLAACLVYLKAFSGECSTPKPILYRRPSPSREFASPFSAAISAQRTASPTGSSQAMHCW